MLLFACYAGGRTASDHLSATAGCALGGESPRSTPDQAAHEARKTADLARRALDARLHRDQPWDSPCCQGVRLSPVTAVGHLNSPSRAGYRRRHVSLTRARSPLARRCSGPDLTLRNPADVSALADDGNICASLCPSPCRVAAMAPALASHRKAAGAPKQPSPAGRSLRKNWPRGRQGQSPSKCSRRAIAQCRWRLATALRALARSLGFHIRTRPPAARPELATRFDAYQVGCTRTQPAGEAVSHLSHRQPRLPPDVSEYGSLPHLPARSFRPHQSWVFHRVRIGRRGDARGSHTTGTVGRGRSLERRPLRRPSEPRDPAALGPAVSDQSPSGGRTMRAKNASTYAPTLGSISRSVRGLGRFRPAVTLAGLVVAFGCA